MKTQEYDGKSSGGRGAKRRRLPPEARRVELLEAALRVLRNQGPTNARVEDVTKEAGAAKGTFYLYFASWEDLLVQVRAYVLSNYVSGMHERFPDAARMDWWRAFERECVKFVDFHEELGDLHKAIFHGPIEEYPVDQAISAENVVGWMLRLGIESGACRPVEPDIAARLLFAMLHAMADNIVLTGDRERNLAGFFDLAHAWLRPSRVSPEDKQSNAAV